MKPCRCFNALILMIGATLVFYALPRSFAQEGARTHPVTVTGRALDENGNPIEDAEIYLASPRTGRVIGIWYSNEKGEFRFEKVPLPIEKADTNEGRDSGSFEVFGKAEGYAFAWRPLKWFYPDREKVLDTSPSNRAEDQQAGFGTKDKIVLDLKFVPPTKLSGRVIDESGHGIANARVYIKDAEPYREDHFGSGTFESLNDQRLIPADMNSRQTDSDGRFEFSHLPADCLFWINVSPPGYSSRLVSATNRPGAEENLEGKSLYQDGFELKFAKPRDVSFRIVYGDTKEPAKGVGIGGKVTEAGFWETTNAEGLVKADIADGKYELGLSPRFGSAYLPTDHSVTITEKSTAEPIQLELDPGVEVNITVVDAESGKPLEGTDVWWEQKTADGQTYEEVRGWRSWEVETRISHYEAPRTDKQGRMRVLFPLGKHKIGIGMRTWPKGYEAVDTQGREIECALGQSVNVEFKMRKL